MSSDKPGLAFLAVTDWVEKHCLLGGVKKQHGLTAPAVLTLRPLHSLLLWSGPGRHLLVIYNLKVLLGSGGACL